VILFDQYINMSDISRVVDYTPILQVIPVVGQEELIRTQLNNSHPEMKAYLKSEIPQRWHYQNNDRITPVIAVANEGWSITTSEIYNLHKSYFNGGNHGYDNKYHSMRGIFIANGPDFAKGKIVKAFENVDVYPTLCSILRLIPAPNNGTIATGVLA